MKKLKKIPFADIFGKYFGFEHGIDISDETQLLFRRNVVIKNIIFLSNLVFTVLMTVNSFLNSTGSNWILTAILFPLTFLVNKTLKNMIYKHKDDIMHQTIAMYIACFYMFLLSIIIYMKMKTADKSFGEAGYMLLYYSLVIVSLYQDKKLLKTLSKWFVVIITILHFTITYNVVNMSFEGSTIKQILTFINSTYFTDVALRTIILIIFILVLYVIVSISQYMQDERRKELIKRQEVQDDFTKVITDMFNVTLSSNIISSEEKNHIEIVAVMSKRFAEILGKNDEEVNEVYDFSRIHIDKNVDLNLTNITNKDDQFEHLRRQTSLGNEIIRRLQLERRCDDIIRSQVAGTIDVEATNKLKAEKRTEAEQIILLCDMYISLRSVRSYKRPYPHTLSMNVLEKEFNGYYSNYIFERFVRFQDEFEKIYDNF